MRKYIKMMEKKNGKLIRNNENYVIFLMFCEIVIDINTIFKSFYEGEGS